MGRKSHSRDSVTSVPMSEVDTVPGGDSASPVVVEILEGSFGGMGTQVVQTELSVSPLRPEDDDDHDQKELDTSFKDLNELQKRGDKNIQVLHQDLRSEFQRPRRQVAKEFRQRHHPSTGDGKPLSLCGTSTGSYVHLGCGKVSKGIQQSKDLLRFGAGVSSYFKGLKLMFWMYFTLSMLQLPVVLFNIIAGEHFADLSIPFAQTTLANLYRAPSANFSRVEEYEVELSICADGVCKLDVDSVLFYYGCADALTSITFLLFATAGVYFAKREGSRFRRKILKVENYSVQVENVPADCSVEELTAHFESVVQGKVFDVQIVQTTGNAISVCVQRGKLIKKLARVRATKLFFEKRNAPLNKLEKLQQRYDELHDAVVELDKKAERNAEEGRALFAFVTFENQRDRSRCVQMYKALYLSWSCAQNPELQLRGSHPIKIVEAPPPSTLLWENNEVSGFSRSLRNVGSIALLLLLLLATGVINYVTEPYKFSKNLFDSIQGSTNYATICDGRFANASSAEEALATALANPAYELVNRPGVTLVGCFCENELNPAGANFNTTTLTTDVFGDGGACSSFLTSRWADSAVQIGVSLGTLLINTLVFFTLTETGNFMKYSSILQRESTILKRLFIATYINTAVLVVLINADLPTIFGFELGAQADKLFGNGSYIDFSPDWYSVAGMEVLLIGLLNIFAPHGYPLLLAFINTFRRMVRLPVSQSDLNDLWLGPDFVLSFRYSTNLMMAWFIMTFSTGIPVLYLFGMASVALSYWVDKYFFTKVCRTPIQFSATLPVWTFKTLQKAVVVHILIGIWMLSSPFVFPLTAAESQLGILNALTGAAGITPDDLKQFKDTNGASGFLQDYGAQIQTRFLREASIPNLILLLILVMIFMLSYLETFAKAFSQCIARVFAAFVSCLRKTGIRGVLDAYDDDRQLTFSQALDLGDVQGISSYSILDNPTYSRAFMRDSKMSGGKTQTLLEVLKQRATDGAGLSDAFSVMGDSYLTSKSGSSTAS